MADHRQLSVVLSEFTQLLLTDFDVDAVLDQLCGRAAELLPVMGAGVTLQTDDGLRTSWCSDARVGAVERLQTTLGEGPCRTVLATEQQVRADLVEDGWRWPEYSAAARDLGVRTLAGLPLQGRGQTFGVLSLYSAEEHQLGSEHMHAAQLLTDAATAMVISARERQAAALAEERLRLQALHDPLTGLPNRLLLLDRLEHALAASQRRPGSVGLLFLDLDRFKQVNDGYGHAMGDKLLLAVADRLGTTLRPSDTLARFGGDEFVVLCEELEGSPDPADVVLSGIAHRLLTVLTQPFTLSEAELMVRASVGAVLATEADDAMRMLRDADSAMYQAKRSGGGVLVSNRSGGPELASAVRTEAELYRALERDEFRVFFQPVLPLRGRHGWRGAEALLRWQHPERGLLLPSEFLPLAELSGQIVEIGRWVLREACARLSAPAPAGWPRDWSVSVNVSAAQLRRQDFVSDVLQALRDHAVDASRLVLEITETVLISDSGRTMPVVRALAEAGVRIAIDDFGTGYSSLAYLKELPVSMLKIDRFFVQGMDSDPKDVAVVRGIVRIAHELGLTVVAEGVETKRHAQLLLEADCDAAQGFLFGRPEPPVLTAESRIPETRPFVPAALPGVTAPGDPAARPARRLHDRPRSVPPDDR